MTKRGVETGSVMGASTGGGPRAFRWLPAVLFAAACGGDGSGTEVETLRPCNIFACDDEDACTRDDCGVDGECVHEPIPEGGSCGPSGTCQSGQCITVEQRCTGDAECSDGNDCNGRETCGSDGACSSGTPLGCDDENACTSDRCDPDVGCAHETLAAGTACGTGLVCSGGRCEPSSACSNDADCNDPNICNGLETCRDGVCQPGVPLVCSDSDPCTGDETCDPTTGCLQGPAPDCDDGNVCTVDSCIARQGCDHAAMAEGSVCGERQACLNSACTQVACNADADCINTNACDGIERCVGHACVAGTALVCNDQDACNGVETCALASGCVAGTAPDCDDDNPCTTDLCTGTAGCDHPALADGTQCGEGLICTSGDCLPAECIEATGCEDGNVCNGTATCVLGRCQAGTPLACDDGDACNGVETCNTASGCVAGTAPDCNDENPCTDDACNPSGGCPHPAVSAGTACGERLGCVGTSCLPVACTLAAHCSDGNPCNGEEVCSNFVCGPGAPPAEGAACGTGGACRAGACVRTVPASFVDTGYFLYGVNSSTGGSQSFRFQSPDAEHQTYFVGNLNLAASSTNIERRAYFAFDLPDIGSDRPIAATLRLWAVSPHSRFNAGFGAYASPDSSETFRLFDVSTPAATLLAAPFNQVAVGDADDAIFADLGSGTLLGERVFTVADEENPGLVPGPTASPSTNCALAEQPCGKFVEITLNAAALEQLSGGARRWIAGGAVSTIGPVANAREWLNNGVLVDLNVVKKPDAREYVAAAPQLLIHLPSP